MTGMYRKFYLTMLVCLLALGAHPLYNGVRAVALSLSVGVLQPSDYARYTIPYAALALAVLLVCALQPAVLRLTMRAAIPCAILLALVVFALVELPMERIRIVNDGVQPFLGEGCPEPDIAVWQMALCSVSPALIRAYERRGAAFVGEDGFYYASNNISYKLHYWLISAVLIAMFVGALYAIGRACRRDEKPARADWLRLGCAWILLGLCLYANVTGFFRDTSPIQTPLAGGLTALFFVALGGCFGSFAGSFLPAPRRHMARAVGALVGALTTAAMYVGELILLDGTLYRFGMGWFFQPLPIPAAPLAVADFAIILLSALVPWLALRGMAASDDIQIPA